MAILKSSLEEDLISRQERVVLRKIAYMSQLSEGLIALRKVKEIGFAGEEPETKRSFPINPMEAYLLQRIDKAFATIRIPNSKSDGNDKVVTQDSE